MDTEEYPETKWTNSEQDAPEYYEPEEQIKEESPLDEQNPLSNSEIIFGERRSPLLWTSFTLETEPEIDLERSFQALSLNDEPTETRKKDPEETMAQPGSGNDAKEVKMNYPKIFTGNRNEFKRFLQDCKLYLTINDKVYDTNLKKIGFVLALMNDGDAASWKEQFVESCIIMSAANNAPLDMGTFLSFQDIQWIFTSAMWQHHHDFPHGWWSNLRARRIHQA